MVIVNKNSFERFIQKYICQQQTEKNYQLDSLQKAKAVKPTKAKQTSVVALSTIKSKAT